MSPSARRVRSPRVRRFTWSRPQLEALEDRLLPGDSPLAGTALQAVSGGSHESYITPPSMSVNFDG